MSEFFSEFSIVSRNFLLYPIRPLKEFFELSLSLITAVISRSFPSSYRPSVISFGMKTSPN